MYQGALYERLKYKSTKYDGITVELPEKVRKRIRNLLDEVFREPYWQGINDTTLERIQIAINESVDKPLPDLVAAIEREVNSNGRALTIARTETTGALNGGAHAVYQDLLEDGIVSGRAWDSTLDDDTRRIPRDRFDHVVMDGQVAKGEELFNVSGELAPYPGHHKLSPGNRCNCRCSTHSEISV